MLLKNLQGADVIRLRTLSLPFVVIDGRARRGISAPEESRPLFIPELNHPRRLEGVVRGMRQRNHSTAVIEKVIGGNFHRVLKEIWTL